MKTSNVAPTWQWVLRFYFAMVKANETSEGVKGLREEIESMGPAAKQLIKEHADPKLRKKRPQIEAQLLDWAKRCDAVIAKAEGRL